MNKTEFLQGLKAELEGRMPHSVIQENIRYYDSYISGEVAGGKTEEEVIEALGGPKIIGRTIIDAAMDAEDRPVDYDTYGSGAAYDTGSEGSGDRRRDTYGYSQRDARQDRKEHVHYIDFSKWYVRLMAGLVVFLVILLAMGIFFGLIGLAGLILSYIGPVLLVFLIIWMFKGPKR